MLQCCTTGQTYVVGLYIFVHSCTYLYILIFVYIQIHWVKM